MSRIKGSAIVLVSAAFLVGQPPLLLGIATCVVGAGEPHRGADCRQRAAEALLVDPVDRDPGRVEPAPADGPPVDRHPLDEPAK